MAEDLDELEARCDLQAELEAQLEAELSLGGTREGDFGIRRE